MRNLFCRLLLISTLIVLIGSVSVRLRADKKAMRNSLVRFGKRSAENDLVPAVDDFADVYEHRNPFLFSVYVNRPPFILEPF
uniref:COesterase domain-containing protein n=1 Tax=Steinernema glaseri TaxID=37863 RepID=A0A1I7ZKE8_9BILA